MFSQRILPGFDEFTFLPASVDGSTRYSSRAGRKRGRSGRGAAPANHSPQPESDSAPRTNDTCGPICFGSSASADLQSFLESRLQARTDLHGSMEYRLTWKVRVTPSGRRICALRASVRRTSGSGCTGWQSPQASWADAGAKSRSGKRKNELLTPELVKGLVGWNTPRATDGTKGGPNQSGGSLAHDAQLAGWATPAARDHKSESCTSDYQAARDSETRGKTLSWQVAATEKRGVLHAAFSRWLMGFPSAWDEASPHYAEWCDVQERIERGDCEHTETP